MTDQAAVIEAVHAVDLHGLHHFHDRSGHLHRHANFVSGIKGIGQGL